MFDSINFLTMNKDFKLTPRFLSPYLYDLSVKDDNGSFKKVNLSFLLNSLDPMIFKNILISKSDKNGKIQDFGGLIIKPNEIETQIYIDVTSSVNFKKIYEDYDGLEEYNIREKKKPLVLEVKRGLRIDRSKDCTFYFNQDEPVKIDAFSSTSSDNLLIAFHAKAENLDAHIERSSDVTFNLHNDVEVFRSSAFNEKNDEHPDRTKGVFHIKGDKDRTKAIKILNCRATYLASNDPSKKVDLTLKANKYIDISGSRILGSYGKREISGNTDELTIVGTDLELEADLKLNVNKFRVLFEDGEIDYPPVLKVEEKSSITCDAFTSKNQTILLKNTHLNAPNGCIQFYNYWRDKPDVYYISLKDFVLNDLSGSGLCLSSFSSQGGSILVEKDRPREPLPPIFTGTADGTTISNFTINDDVNGKKKVFFDIFQDSGAPNGYRHFNNVTFSNNTHVSITSPLNDKSSANFENCIFSVEKHTFNIKKSDLTALNSEFKNSNMIIDGKITESGRISQITVNNSIIEERATFKDIDNIKIDSSAIKESTLDGVEKVSDSCLENTYNKGKNLVNITPEGIVSDRKDPGMATQEIELV